MQSRISIILFCFIISVVCVHAQKVVSLYNDGVPNAIGLKIEEFQKGDDLQIFNVSQPTLTAYLPDKKNANGTAIIICPGGGYGSLVINREGHDVARAFAKKGIAAFVLKYRLPDSRIMKDRSVGPIQDAQQAIAMVRKNAGIYNINTSKVGIMGFSAGGHLAASAGILSDSAFISNNSKINLRPDFMLLIYPVVTMDTLVGHKGSTFNLLGENPDPRAIERFSLELHVTERTPPAYITVAQNDDLHDNSILLYQALKKNKIPSELHIYSTGGHGFMKYPSFEDWTFPLYKWLKLNHWSN